MGEKKFGFCVPWTALDGPAHPAFCAIGAKARDVFGGYVLGVFNLGIKAKTEYGVDLSTSTSANKESNSISGAIQANYKGNGFTFGEKWTNDNILSADLAFIDFCQGAKVALGLTENFEASETKFNMTADWRCENAAIVLGTEFKSAKPVVNGSIAVGNSNIHVGYSTSFNSEETSFSTHKLAAEYAAEQFTVCAGVDDFKNLTLSFYHKTTDDLDCGVMVKYTSGDESSDINLALGLKYNVDPDCSVRFKVDSNATVGLSLSQKVRDGVSLTLSSSLEAKDPFEGQHKLGFGLSIEA